VGAIIGVGKLLPRIIVKVNSLVVYEIIPSSIGSRSLNCFDAIIFVLLPISIIVQVI
jgi:hypothetical protein